MLPDRIAVLGDTHLGRTFKTGVPLHRLGEREEQVWEQFEDRLRNFSKDAEIHVHMGDLFDKTVVPPAVVLGAAEAYLNAAAIYEYVTFVILEGNHDRPKDSTKRSSFDIFAALVADVENIVVVQGEPVVIDGFGFVPYHPFEPTRDLVAQLPDDLEAVFGHWDIQDWGGDNVIPTELLASKGIALAVSGHDHLARTEKRHGVDILVTGSMQPYSHAEDAKGDLYVTVELPIDEDLTGKNVRVLLKDGEELPEDLDCLSLTAKRVRDEDEDLEVDTTEFESLDLRTLLAGALEGLSVKDEILEKFE